MSNSNTWNNIYENTDFGNKYASSYLVSLYHTRIKPELLKYKKINELNVLDFGCSLGANSVIFKNQGLNVFGIDVSKKAIEKLIENGIGDSEHFKAVNLLDADEMLNNIFVDVKFDFIVASECMYYFTNDERRLLINKFIDVMETQGMFYVSMPTYNYSLYRAYKDIPKNEKGMIEVKKSGSISQSLCVNLPCNIEEMRQMFSPLHVIDIMTTDEQIYSNEPMVEYHLIAIKS